MTTDPEIDGHELASAADDGELAWLGTDHGGLRELALCWATVDLERVLVDLGLAPGLAAATVADPLLGARVLALDGPGPGAGSAVGGDGRIALAEPTTEGRLAAFLARHGEGPAGRYIGVGATVAAIATRAAAAGVSVSRAETGPFGPEVVVLGGRLGSPLLILVEVAAVPSRP